MQQRAHILLNKLEKICRSQLFLRGEIATPSFCVISA